MAAARRRVTASARLRRVRSARRPAKSAKRSPKPAPKPAKPVRVAAQPELALFRVCRPGWAVIVERTPNALGTRFVCPFCPLSHRVPGPVRGFRKLRKAQWVKLRRVSE